MVDVDVVEADGGLPQPHLAGSRIANRNRLPIQHFGATGGVNADRVRHAGTFRRGGRPFRLDAAMGAFYGL